MFPDLSTPPPGLEPGTLELTAPRTANCAIREWRRGVELNHLPGAYETPVQPIHFPTAFNNLSIYMLDCQVGDTGIEPVTACL